MNILFFADPNSIHDEKWISYFADNKLNKTYILPRAGQINPSVIRSFKSNSTLLEPIIDFSIFRFYQTVITAFKIKALIKKYKIDIIHILYAEPNALWSIFRFFFKIPIIISSRGTDVLRTIPNTFRQRTLINSLVGPAYKKAFLSADWVTCTSLKQKKVISSFSGRLEKFSIVRTGVDLDRLNKNSGLPLPLTGIFDYIFFPRYITPLYNHEFCLEAIDLLPPALKKKYKMVFIGRNSGDSAYQEVLETKMRSIDNVDFIFLEKQSQEALFELYKMASLVVMTPLSDGSPVSAMEALLCGTKLILGPLEYDEEIFSGAAVILKQWSVAELAETIIKVLSEPNHKMMLTERTKQLMDRNYNMNQIDLIYKRILNGN
jgi:glycosyltransferase involved in cell wall biosynthesis